MGFERFTRQQYDAHPALRSTALKEFISEGPWYYHARYVEKSLPQKEPSDQMVLGTLVHEYVLEEIKGWVTWRGSRQTKAYKEFKSEHNGTPILNVEPVGTLNEPAVLGMVDAILKNNAARRLLRENRFAEDAVTWTDKKTGIECKALIDSIQHDGTLADLKTTHDVDWYKFFRTHIAEYRADVSAAYYMRGVRALTGMRGLRFRWVAVNQNGPPYRAVVYACPDDVLAIADDVVRGGLERLRHCLETDTWPDPLQNDVQYVAAPDWWLLEHRYGG